MRFGAPAVAGGHCGNYFRDGGPQIGDQYDGGHQLGDQYDGGHQLGDQYDGGHMVTKMMLALESKGHHYFGSAMATIIIGSSEIVTIMK